jgi:hypothetical protein
MSLVTSAQLAAERMATAETFTDTAQRLVYGASDGEYGPGTVGDYVAGASFACSFQPKSVRDAQGETQVQMEDADLYCAVGTTLDADDRLTITHLYGEAVANPLTYNVAAGPVLDGNLQHVELRLVTDEDNDA